MKIINKFKSPNYNLRNTPKIKYIIIHYTSLKNGNIAISYLCNPKNKVSSHYLICQNGDIYCLVNTKYKAWHAGISSWLDDVNLNSCSIGIELDFSYTYSNKHFSNLMIKSLITLIKKLKIKYKIKQENILGHSDIAPFRKIDPGYKFPWRKLEKHKMGFLPTKNFNKEIKLVNLWFEKYKLNNKRLAIIILSFIGYDTENCTINYLLFKKLIKNYQSHFLPINISSKLDELTIYTLKNHLLNLLLKNK